MPGPFILALLSRAGVAAATQLSRDVQVPAETVRVPGGRETLVVQGLRVTLPSRDGKVFIRGCLCLNVGKAATAVTLAIYRGKGTRGTLLADKRSLDGDFVPGKPATFEIEVTDPQPSRRYPWYCMSVQQSGALGDGAILSALIDSKVLSG